MKRFLGILLSITLLFTLFGCGKTPPAEPDATTAAPTESEPTTAPEPEKAVFSLRTLPEIGTFVSDEKKACFFDDGAHDDFEPRDDYGKIVPYCASTEEYYPTDWSYTDEETGEVFQGSTPEGEGGYFERYGFATADGKIITGGIYADVYRYEDSRGDVMYAAYPETSYEMYGKVDLITSDGSRLLRFDDEDTELSVRGGFVEDRNIGYVMVGSKNKATMYDYSCNKLADLTPYLTNEYMHIPYIEYVDEKSMLIRIDDDEGNSRFYRYGFDGKVLTAFPKEFSYMRGVYGNDVLIMSGDDDWQLVSMDGKALSDDYFEVLWSDYYNCFFGVTDGEMECYDADGKMVEERNDYEFGRLESGHDYNYLYDPETGSLLDASFQQVPLTIDNGQIVLVECLYGWEDPGACKLLVRTDTDDLYVFSNSGERLAKVQNVLYSTWDSDEDGVNNEVRPGVEERNYNVSAGGDMIFAEKKKSMEIVDLKTGRTASMPIPKTYKSCWGNALNDHVFSLSYEKDEDTYQMYYDLYRRSDGERLLTGAVFAESYGDVIAAATATHSYLMDKTGKILLCLKNDKLV